MKKLWLIAAICGSMSTAVMAQDAEHMRRDPKQRVEMQTEMMAKRLNLTDEQKAKVMEINKQSAAEMQNGRTEGQPMDKGPEAMAYRKKTMEARDARMKTVLTKEQYAKYEQMRNERMERMQEHHPVMKK